MYTFIEDDRGVTATEYCLLISLSGGTAFLFLNSYAESIRSLYFYIGNIFGL